jgi:hypothetical protein
VIATPRLARPNLRFLDVERGLGQRRQIVVSLDHSDSYHRDGGYGRVGRRLGYDILCLDILGMAALLCLNNLGVARVEPMRPRRGTLGR